MAIAARRRAQFEEMYRVHAQAIYTYCLRRTSLEEAKDATADVFVVAWRRLGDMPSDDRVKPWLYGVARNVLNDRRRAARRRDRLAAKMASHRQPSVPSPEVQVVRHSEHEQVLAAMDKLPEKDRETILLVEWEGMSRDEVAEMMFVSRAAIDKRIARAYRKMARSLGVNRSTLATTPVPIEEGGEA